MRNQRKWYAWILIIAMMLAALDIEAWNKANGAAAEKKSNAVQDVAGTTWIIKWKDTPDPEFIVSSIIEREYDESKTAVVRPLPGRNAAEWLAQWENSPHVQYIVPNKEVGISAAANDPFIEKQSYLVQTHTIEAWNQVNRNDSIVIAVVDTGVDLDHPDLKGNLVPGVNLIQPKLPPRDDNGHGTNVAGVIAAIGNNNKGVAGMLWKAGIMPIKALEPNGRGDEDKLGAGIRYAVDNGANIVVL
ncbi:MAG: peptidase and in kexin sedolisin, partial [Paenibacillus sp.]|nr:peptidase and in kexin sedolisin [Paenibacillus sp.]